MCSEIKVAGQTLVEFSELSDGLIPQFLSINACLLRPWRANLLQRTCLPIGKHQETATEWFHVQQTIPTLR